MGKELLPKSRLVLKSTLPDGSEIQIIGTNQKGLKAVIDTLASDTETPHTRDEIWQNVKLATGEENNRRLSIYLGGARERLARAHYSIKLITEGRQKIGLKLEKVS